MSGKPKAIVLKAPGTNCDRENIDALQRAGADCELLTTHELLAAPERLQDIQLLFFPGGFAHGDDIASARLWANQCKGRLSDALLDFVNVRGGHVVGICNGFQVLVKTGLLPRTDPNVLTQTVSLVHNASGHYECRWVRMRVESSRCAFLARGDILEMPVGHGEGRFVPGPGFDASAHVALRYVDDTNTPSNEYPWNPNGSIDAIAGITDPTGRVLGLMPHPDRAYLARQHPRGRLTGMTDADMSGARFFRALVTAAGR